MKYEDMPNDEIVDQVKCGDISRRKFNCLLASAGIAVVSTSMAPRTMAASTDQPTYFTRAGWNNPAYYDSYIGANGEPPNLETFDSSEEGFTRMRSGLIVDVAHPCNADIPRWIASGLFQPLDTAQLSNWKDLVPQLWQLEGNVVDGKPYFAPFDWGQTSITYRTDLVNWQDQEESWGLLWDERYSGQIGCLSSAADAWWCAAIYAGINFKDIAHKESIKKVTSLLQKQQPLIRIYSDDTTRLEQAIASGELVAAMTRNGSALALKSEGLPVAFAKPKEGALTWVCGFMLHFNAPKPEKSHELIDSLLSVQRGIQLIDEEGYGHSNARAIAKIPDARLAELGLSRDPQEVLDAGKFKLPQGEIFENLSNGEFEKIKSGL